MRKPDPLRVRAVSMSEADLQASVIEMAQRCGWLVAHFRAGRTKEGGWKTAVSADGAGFPDLVLVRGPRCLFAELKSECGITSPSQSRWLANLMLALPEGSVFIWKPSDWLSGAVDTVLR